MRSTARMQDLNWSGIFLPFGFAWDKESNSEAAEDSKSSSGGWGEREEDILCSCVAFCGLRREKRKKGKRKCHASENKQKKEKRGR